jgi:hypothetical protein
MLLRALMVGIAVSLPQSALARPLTCTWTELIQCDPSAGCKPRSPAPPTHIDPATGRYERCDLNRCTEYLGVVTEGEEGFTIVDLPGQGVFTKIGPAGLATEVVSLDNSTLTSSGICL